MTACLPPRPGPGLLPASAPRRPRSPGRRFSSSSSPLPAKLSDHPPFSLEHALARCCCPHALPHPAAQWPGPLTVPCPSLGRVACRGGRDSVSSLEGQAFRALWAEDWKERVISSMFIQAPGGCHPGQAPSPRSTVSRKHPTLHFPAVRSCRRQLRRHFQRPL